MQLKCKINNIEYKNTLVQGIPFSEEYSEVLDSASIIIDQIPQIKIKPYDDVYIYDANFEFEGFNDNGLLVYNGYLIDKDGYLINEKGKYINELGFVVNENEKKLKCGFYKHFLIDQFNEELLFLNSNELIDNNNNDNLYKYKIELFSETKGLETIQLPNISITQPLKIEQKISIYSYLEQYINIYSPKIKVTENDTQWEYKNKYKLDSSLYDLFKDSYTPDFTLNSPNLRDVLSKLMIAKDMIPYVENNVIKAMDITKRTQEFDMGKGEIGYIYGSLSSANYAENLKTNYINALSQEKSCRMIEYLGFRNSETALMKIEDLRLETRFPIYKINKVYMCYYKKCKIISIDSNNTEKEYSQKSFLCKQDITPLVKLNSERNLLSKNFDEMEKEAPKTIEDMSQYYMCTVGYDIGSNYITGWGNKYEYIINKKLTWFTEEKTYIENIAELVDKINPFGIYDIGYFSLKPNEALSVSANLFADEPTSTFNTENVSLLTPFSNYALALKGFFFIVEYDGFYNGTIITTKDGAESDITINDNQSNSLPLLEYDGLSQKEKINRFGNKGYTIAVRYKNIEDLQPLGSYISKDDVVIYHREYTINDGVINCIYFGMKDYVLKNYFTSVYAKHRPYNLMSYGESISRAENKKMFLLLSKEKQFYEKNNLLILPKNFNKKIFSCFNGFEKDDNNVLSIKHLEYPDRINYAYFVMNNGNGKEKKYVADLNAFVHGNSLCFNSRMYDNVSCGVFIKKHEPFLEEDFETNKWEEILGWFSNPESSYSGMLQSWHMTVDNIETGFLKNIGFYVCHAEQDKIFGDTIKDYIVLDDLKDESRETLKQYYKQLFALPLIDFENEETNVIGNYFEINKDNKEIIDMTYQLEPITMDDNILFSPWMMKLSDLLSNYNKFKEEVPVHSSYPIDLYDCYFEARSLSDYFYHFAENSGDYVNYPFIAFCISEQDFQKLKETYSKYTLTPRVTIDFGDKIEIEKYFAGNEIHGTYTATVGLVLYFDKILNITDEEITFDLSYDRITARVHNKNELPDSREFISGRQNFTLKKVTPDQYNPAPQGYLRFSNLRDHEGGKDKETEELTKIDGIDPNWFLLEFSKVKKEVTFNKIKNEANFNYPQNMFVLGSNDFLKKELVYNEYPYNPVKQAQKNFKNQIENSKIVFKNVFYVTNDSIVIDIKYLKSIGDYKSLQFWYLDGMEVGGNFDDGYFADYKKASYKFVFGVNLTNEDLKKDKIKIYISTLSSMNKKVYDENYNLIGETYNYLSEEAPEKDLLCERMKMTLPLDIKDILKSNKMREQEPIHIFWASRIAAEPTENNYYLKYDYVKEKMYLETDENTRYIWVPEKIMFTEDNENGIMFVNLDNENYSGMIDEKNIKIKFDGFKYIDDGKQYYKKY